MIELNDLHFQYPKSDFYMHVPALKMNSGSKTAVIGPSGSGKTTLLNLVAGILIPNRGQLLVNNMNPQLLSEKERRNFRIKTIGFVFQDFRLISYLNGLDNILLPYRINQSVQLKPDTLSSAHELAEEMGIASKLKKYPDKLSQGEKQRMAICRALITRPQVVLADEPTGNLDPDNKSKIMKLLFSYASRNNGTLITVTHDHEMLKGFDSTINFKDFQVKHL